MSTALRHLPPHCLTLPKSIRMNGWLPRLDYDNCQWWLPLSDAAAGVLAKSIMCGQGDAELESNSDSAVRLNRAPLKSAPGPLRAEIKSLFADDPALLIYSVLGAHLQFGDDPVGAEQGCADVSLDCLADWLVSTAEQRFLGSDGFLGAPSFTSELSDRFRKLQAYFCTQPLGTWVGQADMWLEVTGPPIPFDWYQTWPAINVDDESASLDDSDRAAAPAHLMLQQLARQSRSARSLRTQFDASLHRSKLGAIKQLAYGLSHEINNPLANISTRAQHLQRDELDESRSATLQRIVDQVYRAHEMIADLMFYANPSTPLPTDANLAELLVSVTDEFRGEADRLSIVLQTETPDDGVTGLVDTTMIREAIHALIRNSIEAIGCEGTVIASLVVEADRVLFHIADSGPGLSAAARDHAFDPYFSGREAGRGLGLGLCRVYRVAELHHGQISLTAAPAGCVATFSLPRYR